MSYRSDFEVAFLFHPIVTGPGSLVKKSDGTYKNDRAEAAYLGYEMARRGDHEHLKRFSPDRSIPMGLMKQINDELHKLGLLNVTPETVRTILIAVGGSPS